MAEIGKLARLEVLKQAPQGLYLDGGPLGDILLPKAQVPDWATPGNALEVFVYCDSEDRPIATTRKPFAQSGQFASLEVVSVNPKLGAFLDWGLDKDLLLPFANKSGAYARACEQSFIFTATKSANASSPALAYVGF